MHNTAPVTGFEPKDDLRHRPQSGGRMRDSLFWEVVIPEERVGIQVYLYLTDRGRTGYNVVVWGADSAEPLVMELAAGEVDDATDLDAFSLSGLSITQARPLHSSSVRFHSADATLELEFEAIHEPFSYRSNPDGLPAWFAVNRLEQTGRVRGALEFGGRHLEFDQLGHRDHSWGMRDWGVPHHWKWFVAYTPSGRALNGWSWIAKGEWGFAGYVIRNGVTVPVRTIQHRAEYDALMRQRSLDAVLVDVLGEETHLTMESFGAVTLPSHDSMATVITEAACIASIDGESGAGQFETHWQGAYRDYLIGRDT
jgi:hypothetical protein